MEEFYERENRARQQGHRQDQGKINEFQARLRELEKQKTELENIEIVEAVRGTDISLDDLPVVLKVPSEQNGALSLRAKLARS